MFSILYLSILHSGNTVDRRFFSKWSLPFPCPTGGIHFSTTDVGLRSWACFLVPCFLHENRASFWLEKDEICVKQT